MLVARLRRSALIFAAAGFIPTRTLVASAMPDASGPRVRLSDGRDMPALGLGTWKSKPGEVQQAVAHAIRAGYRHIDCAAVYKNEAEVGAGIAECIDAGVVTREELWVTSKLWNSEHAAEAVPAACEKTLRDLRLEYVDLYLVHWPVTGVAGPELKPPMSETWAAMEQLRVQGKAKSIGVSNFSAKKLRDVCEHAAVPPAVNQVEVHPLFRQDKLIAACKELGVHVTAYSPLGSPDSATMLKREAPSVLDHPVVVQVAERTGRSTGQVLIRWALQRGTSVIPKSVTPARIDANLAVLDFELSPEDMAALDSIEPQVRMVAGAFWLSPEGPYKTLEDLWDE